MKRKKKKSTDIPHTHIPYIASFDEMKRRRGKNKA